MEVYLIRHTRPNIVKGVCYGQSDIPLSDSFNSEKQKVLRILPKRFEVVYTSPAIRCFQLAQAVQSKVFKIDKALLEMNFGDWEMKKWDEINQRELNSWMENFLTVKTPNGESFFDLENRVQKFIQKLLKQNYKKIAIITHAGVIRCITGKVAQIPASDIFKITFDYGSVTKLILDPNNAYNKVVYMNNSTSAEKPLLPI